MRLRNKKTGEIGKLSVWRRADNGEVTGFAVLAKNEKVPVDYDSLSELSADWEDVPEEPKEYYLINLWGEVSVEDGKYQRPGLSELGLTFETEEEAELAVRKLKAWKRLKDKGFSIYNWDYEFDIVDKPSQTIILRASAVDNSNKDLDLLFGGGE